MSKPRLTPKHRNLSRSLVHHDWATLEEWIQNLDELSQLTDDEIDDLARLAANDDGFDDD